MKREAGPVARRWYLLIHQLPPKPLYLRAKIRQRLARVGAIAVKNSVYVLPFRDECLEDFQWIAQEAVAGGGEARVCAAEFAERAFDEELVARFRAERSVDYERLAQTLRGRPRGSRSRSRAEDGGGDASAELARARRRFEEIARIDFFEAPGRDRAERALAQIESRPDRARARARGGAARFPQSRTWVTRRGVQVDRIASAWLIRRFLDPKARFRFVDPKDPARAGEIRFDMVGGDFTHEGDACTFETLLSRAGLDDKSLEAIGEIVHDIDLKDAKFGRAEAAGVAQVLTGLLLACPADSERLERGAALFDGLYDSLRRGRRP
jgi:hypothetical protein